MTSLAPGEELQTVSSADAHARVLLGKLVTELSNWYSAVPAGIVVERSRFWPGVRASWLAGRTISLKLRTGEELHIRADEFGVFVEVFCSRVYSHPKVDPLQCRSIVDVGAHVGLATAWLAREYPASTILAVEPLPETAARLRANLTLNGLTPRVQVMEAAVAATDGTATPRRTHRSTMATVVQDPREEPSSSLELSGRHSSSVLPVVSVNTLMSRVIGPVDLMKIDCEGAEFDLLSSHSHDDLLRVRALIGEYHLSPGRSRDEFTSLLRDRGYSAIGMGPARSGVGLFWACRE